MWVSVKLDGIDKIRDKVQRIYSLAEQMKKELQDLNCIRDDVKFEITEAPIGEDKIINGCYIENEDNK